MPLKAFFSSISGWRPGRRIFVSYRRADTQEIADLLYERLALQFGASNVFMDRADIEHGERWRDAVTRQITAADMFIVLIGPTWLEALRARAKQDDVLRSELTSALEHRKQIIPVLVDGAAMPYAGQLPPEVRGLIEYQALPLTAATLDRAMLSLMGRLKPGWRLATAWAFGQLFGGILGLAILMIAVAGYGWLDGRRTVQFAASYPFVAGAIAGALAGACVAAPQWLVLRAWFARARHLVPAYSVLCALATGFAGSVDPGDETSKTILGLMVFVLPVAFTAALWWVVSERLAYAGWWSAANLIAPAAGLAVAAAMRGETGDTVQGARATLSEATSVLADFLLPLILLSLAVGWLLVWLMRRSEIRRR